MRTLLFLLGTVVASMIVSVLGLCVVRYLVPIETLRANNDTVGNYLQTLGTIYAVLLAFVVFMVWTQQNDAAKSVEREANELADVLRILRASAEPVCKQILDATMAYAREVIDHEWPAMARGSPTSRAGELMESIWAAMQCMHPQTPREQALFTEALSRFNDFNDARTDRLQSSRTRMPPTLWILLVTGGLVTVASMYLFGLDSFLVHALMTASMAGEVSFVLFLIGDLDNPFDGDWQVTPEPICQLLRHLERLH
jgi:Protein of unknown function (DUF4239)